MTSGELQLKVKAYDPTANLAVIEDAYRFSAEVHEGQKRMSGEDYFTHPVAVAGILADMKLDVPSIVTGLLHDTVEDTLTTSEAISTRFGAEIGALVDGVTKISALEESGREQVQADSLRKMFLASARDIRVLLVKFADRYHNIQTLEHLPAERRKRIAQETLDLYVPLAHRAGIHWLKNRYEELAFRALDPAAFAEIREKLDMHTVEREGYIEEITGLLAKRLRDAGIESEVSGRLKSAYSIHRKMTEQGLHHDEVYDVVAYRVVVNSDRDCYDALGVVHMYWQPVPGRFRDYIALPKANLYQSLHTTVIGPYGERMEVQVRTHVMHQVAELGIAAHWKYKAREDGDGNDAIARFAWLNQLIDWQEQVQDPREYLLNLKQDLFTEEVYVFTPKGETKTFPQGATVVDFAYRIHSDIGDHCAGARVNGKLVPVRHVLAQGDTVEILTTPDQNPSRDWLRSVVTPRARQRIALRLKQEERSRAIALGRQILERDLSEHHFDLARLHREGRMADLLKTLQRPDEDSLLEAIGYGRLTPRRVLERLVPPEALAQKAKGRGRLSALFALISRTRKPEVTVAGAEDTVVRFAKCCQPLPGEPVAGLLTRGRGVTVHARSCSRFTSAEADRRVDVAWGRGARAARSVKLQVSSRDRPGVLAAMSQAIASAGVNIVRAQVRGATGGAANNTFEVSVKTLEELEQVIRNLRRVPGVKAVTRERS